MDASPKYTVDGLPVVSKETFEAFLHDISNMTPKESHSMMLKYAYELDNENPYLSKIISLFALGTDPKLSRTLLESVLISYKLLKSQMQNNKILEMLNGKDS